MREHEYQKLSEQNASDEDKQKAKSKNGMARAQSYESESDMMKDRWCSGIVLPANGAPLQTAILL